MDTVKLSRGKRWPPSIRLTVEYYAARGYTAVQLAKMLRVRHNFVASRQSLHAALKRNGKSPIYPRHRKVLHIHKSIVDLELHKNPEISTQTLRDILVNDFGVRISLPHIARVRRELGWTARKTQYCQMISAKNKKHRIEWCLQKLSEEDRFLNVIFSDETSIEMSSSGKLFFYKPRSEFEKLPAKAPKPKHPYKVHMWGGISYKGRTSCCIFTGTMDSLIYQEILRCNLIPFVENKYPSGFRLYQDNDSKHNSKSTKEWMQSVGILDAVMVTPASSPDLNPIENVWAALKDHLHRNVKPRTKQALIDGIVNWWEMLTPEKCSRYIDHIHRVIPQVVLNNGGPTVF